MSTPHTRGQLRRRYLEQASVSALLIAAAALFLSFGLVPAALGYILTAATFGTVTLAVALAVTLPALRPALAVDCPRCNRHHQLLRRYAWLHCPCRSFVVLGANGPVAVMPLASTPYPVADPAS